MGSQFNFVDDAKQPALGAGVPLTRQNSVFSLTFDEFQNSWGGGVGKDFGSMNMDELLKNIWTAEESHSIMANNTREIGVGGGLQRQGSITLPRTISQKRVDDVWKELMKDDDAGSGGGGASGVPQRQQTLGEMTLEEFLVRAGVVREEPQQVERKVHQPQQLIQKQQDVAFPKQSTIAFSNTVDLVNRSQPPTQEVKPSVLGVRDRPMNNNNLLQAVDFKTGVTVAAVSPGSQMSPELTPKSNMDASLSPVPYMFGRVRKTGAVLEKVIERRQKRMIKNRESAARSRARKQAYTLELEAEVAQLKEQNEELQRKQVEIIEKQKKQLLEPMRQPWGCKRQCLRRTLTGPW
ncbi:BnaAnng26550D [Brassica napus]|uniref:BnaAnng26550D protein n=1 Tax=Brassica napus TaxID=3708 RepID=A0A078JS33_BRANA|nr:BnaAnng26550D [Brassica napus]